MSDGPACSELGIPYGAITDVIARYRPPGVSAQALAFAQGAVSVARPPSVPRARTVPVLSTYHDRLLEAAGNAGERFICGGELLGRKNVTANLVGKLAGGTDLPRLEVARLRSTWLADVADRVGIGVLLGVSGLRRSSRLSDFAGRGDPPDEATVVSMCGGMR